MIKFENTEVVGWEAAIRGMRNPMNSWDKSDSGFGCGSDSNCFCIRCSSVFHCTSSYNNYIIGPNDLDLMMRLRKSGTPDHRKFMRMIVVYVDIIAPLYWWKEFDTYKVGTVANSCSTMHKIADKEFTLDDFSYEQLDGDGRYPFMIQLGGDGYSTVSINAVQYLMSIVDILNQYRKAYIKTKDKFYWWQMIQLLPSSYNQRRTVMLNYEVLTNMYHARKNHKLDEWAEHNRENEIIGFCDWVKTLPYSELITEESNNETIIPKT